MSVYFFYYALEFIAMKSAFAIKNSNYKKYVAYFCYIYFETQICILLKHYRNVTQENYMYIVGRSVFF